MHLRHARDPGAGNCLAGAGVAVGSLLSHHRVSGVRTGEDLSSLRRRCLFEKEHADPVGFGLAETDVADRPAAAATDLIGHYHWLPYGQDPARTARGRDDEQMTEIPHGAIFRVTLPVA